MNPLPQTTRKINSIEVHKEYKCKFLSKLYGPQVRNPYVLILKGWAAGDFIWVAK